MESKEMLDELIVKASSQIKEEMAKAADAIKTTVLDINAQKGYATAEQYKALEDAQTISAEKVEGILKAQGITLADLQVKMSQSEGAVKSIPEVLKDNEELLRKQYSNGVGTKDFMLFVNTKGETVFEPFDRTKAAGPTGTIPGLITDGLASVTQSISGSSVLRAAANSPIVDNYTNTAWLFDLVNTTTADFFANNGMSSYWEELPKEGAAALVLEGGTKPLVQYSYVLRTQVYSKFAQMITFTDEFRFDFSKLYGDIMGKGRRDILNGINSAVLTDVTAQATAYNTAASFTGGVALTNENDFDAIAAMAAQVDSATFGNNANAALMSTFKKYRMGVTKTTTGEYLNKPEVLSGINFIGNPTMGADDVVVGDLKQYNLILRGGVIVKVGYNGTDFAENKFSVVMEQFYTNYISEARKSALVKGPTFAAVKTQLTT